MNHYLNVLAVLLVAFSLYYLVRSHVVEGYAFCGATQCSDCVCNRIPYKQYCQSNYLDYGPAGLCQCKWNDASSQCEGTRLWEQGGPEYAGSAMKKLEQDGVLPEDTFIYQ